MLNSSKEIVKSLFETTQKINNSLDELKAVANKISDKYDPRAQFILWRSSSEGRSWKQHQYCNQLGCCAICQVPVELKGSHIDHIKPIALYPLLALDTQNMQIACPDCNTSKGSKLTSSEGIYKVVL